MNNHVADERRAAVIGEVILSARRVESKLHGICGDTEAAGIHALTELLAGRLPVELQRQLHFIAAVRNTAAHEDSFSQTPEEFERFQQSCRNVLDSLDRLFPEHAGNTENKSGKNAEPLDLAVEKEAFAAIKKKLITLGYFPLLGNIYLLYILLYTICLQGILLLLAGLYGCAVILGIKGWYSAADRGLLYVATGALLFAYISTAVLSFYAPVKKLPRVIGILPVLNIMYLIIRWLRDLKWGHFLLAVSGLACLFAATVLIGKNFYSYAAAALFANWLICVSSAFILEKKREK